MTTAIERLEQMLDDKDDEIADLKGKLENAERELDNDLGWVRHKSYKPGKEPSPELPVPRLEVRWSQVSDGIAAAYSLVYRHLLNEIVFIPLGMTRSSGALSNRIREGIIETPFRDGCHFANEMRQLNLRGFVIAGDRTYEAKLCSRCDRLEEMHRREPFGDGCTMPRSDP